MENMLLLLLLDTDEGICVVTHKSHMVCMCKQFFWVNARSRVFFFNLLDLKRIIRLLIQFPGRFGIEKSNRKCSQTALHFDGDQRQSSIGDISKKFTEYIAIIIIIIINS
jgi:hypothetical protein